MDMKILDEHKDMMYKVGDKVVLRSFNKTYKRYKEKYSGMTATITEIRVFRNQLDTDYRIDIDRDYCWYDEDIDHEATEKLNEPAIQTIVLMSGVRSGRGVSYYKMFNEYIANLESCEFKQIEPKRVIPNKGDQYFLVDICDENLYGIGTWLNDPTDFHILKLGLIKDTAQECVKVAKEMLKKLELEV